jgi:transposase
MPAVSFACDGKDRSSESSYRSRSKNDSPSKGSPPNTAPKRKARRGCAWGTAPCSLQARRWLEKPREILPKQRVFFCFLAQFQSQGLRGTTSWVEEKFEAAAAPSLSGLDKLVWDLGALFLINH